MKTTDFELIKKKYDLFQIPNDKIPVYTTPQEFTIRNFKKCSILKDANISYASSIGSTSKKSGK